MTEKIKSAIEELECDMECGEFYNPSMADSVKLAIRSLKAWEEVLNELENEINLYENSKSIMGCNDFDIEYDGAMKGLGKAIDIINQHLAEIEERN